MALSGQEYRKLRLAEGSSLLKKPLTLTCQVRRGRKRVHYGCVPGEGKNSATYLNNGASGARGPGSAAPRDWAAAARVGSGNLSLRPDAARLTIQIAHEMVKQHDDLLAAPDLIPEEIGCGFDGCPMTDGGIAQVHA